MIKISIFFLLFLFGCQSTGNIEKLLFDYKKLKQVSLSAEKKNIKILYETKYDYPYIDHSLVKPPIYYLNLWLNNNVNLFGKENILEINILDSSLKKSEIINNEIKKYKEKTILLYHINFLVEFILYDSEGFILATSIVEANRSITSGKYISIKENEMIIDKLTFSCLEDFTIKADELLRIYLKDFII